MSNFSEKSLPSINEESASTSRRTSVSRSSIKRRTSRRLLKQRRTSSNSSEDSLEFKSCCSKTAKESLVELLKRKDGVAKLRDFLKSEHSQENLDFWLAVESYNKNNDDGNYMEKANEIYENYIQSNSPFEINITSTLKDEIAQNIQTANSETFKRAQSDVFVLMERDSFMRFQQKK